MASKDKEQSGSVASGGAVVALLIAAGAYLIHKEAPLEGIRPSAQETVFHGYAYHDIDARLWQDPFGAVEKKGNGDPARRACATPGEQVQSNRTKVATSDAPAAPSQAQPPGSEHSNHIDLERDSRSNEQMLVLPVMVSGAPYAEDVEFRRRLRYAIVSALAQKHFQPTDAQHIDYYSVCVTGPDKKSVKMIVPYEWFQRQIESSAESQNVLVLWINEQYLTDTIAKKKTPVKILEDLTRPTIGTAMPGAQLCPSQVSVIGPHTSDALLAIRQERRPSRFKFTSYGATIARAEVEKRQRDESSLCSLIPGPAEIERTIATDDALADRLVDELKLRDVSYAKGHSIALVSEWDTTYGQSIMENFKDAYRKSKSYRSLESDQPRIVEKTYLRGIDGVAASDDKKSEDQRAGKDAAKKADDTEEAFDKRAARAGDRPHGPSQSDYLRRLTDSLIEDDKQIRLKGGPGIKAIGVLGSDVFDKLLVLRALKPNFPDAIFFTTDYDAALTMPSELDWTRNLIVASSFGPMLVDELQGGIPPFRSAYQTSAFLATQLAIDDRNDMAHAEEIRKELGRSQLFEVTRRGTFLALRPPRYAVAAAYPASKHVQREPPHAFPELPKQERFFIASMLAVGGCALLAMASILSWKRRGIQHAEARKEASFIGLILLASTIIAVAWESVGPWLTDYGRGEPIAWSDGVSVWPTIAIRLLVIVLCWLIVARASRRLDDNLYEIAKKLRLACPALVVGRASHPKKLAFNFARDFRPWLDILTPKKATFDCEATRNKFYTIRSGWTGYVCAGRKTARHFRTAFVSLIFLLIFCTIWGVYGNIVPLFEAIWPEDCSS